MSKKECAPKAHIATAKKQIEEKYQEIYKETGQSEVSKDDCTEARLIDWLIQKCVTNDVKSEGKNTKTIRTFLNNNEEFGKQFPAIEPKLWELDNLINVVELLENYEKLEQAFCSDWSIACRRHQGVRGKFAETKVKAFIEKIIAQKYVLLENVMIISGDGRVSPEIDLIICSLEYMPPIFDNHGFQYVPLESVIGIIQVKIGSIGTAQKHMQKINEQFEAIHNQVPSELTMDVARDGKNYENFIDIIRFGSVNPAGRVLYGINQYYYPVRILIHGDCENKEQAVMGYDFTLYVDTESKCLCGKNTSAEKSRLIGAPNPEKVGKEPDIQEEDKDINGYLDFMLALNEELIKINNPNIFNYRKYRALFLDDEKEKDNGN